MAAIEGLSRPARCETASATVMLFFPPSANSGQMLDTGCIESKGQLDSLGDQQPLLRIMPDT